ncbi:hypothetical protein RIF29_16791 [Crotalaria pallida]|uniref:GOLD domain-containing protein n=1 Tax=Crotalaria pallida TaxID=3830 RepID=A0AAN9FLR0_CROPI
MNPLLLLLCLSLIVVVPQANAIWINIPSSGTKCISEEIHTNVVVLGDYYLFTDHESANPETVSVKVTSPYGNTLSHTENVTHGQFAFTTTEGGNYLACFSLNGNNKHKDGTNLVLDWKIGIAAKDWDSVAKKEKIEGVQLELRKLEERAHAISEYLFQLIEKEAKMRGVSERTNARVAWYGIMSLGVCILAAGLQVWRLKRFFQKKKLI